MLMYAVAILVVVLIPPATQLTNLGGFFNAVTLILTVDGRVTSTGSWRCGWGRFWGDLAAAGFVLAVLSSGVSWITGANRGWAATALDGAAPRSFGVISATHETPARIGFVAGVVATATMVLVFWCSSANAAKYVSVVLGLAISTSAHAHLAIVSAPSTLGYSHARVPFASEGDNSSRGW